jgi:hypothetical protein
MARVGERPAGSCIAAGQYQQPSRPRRHAARTAGQAGAPAPLDATAEVDDRKISAVLLPPAAALGVHKPAATNTTRLPGRNELKRSSGRRRPRSLRSREAAHVGQRLHPHERVGRLAVSEQRRATVIERWQVPVPGAWRHTPALATTSSHPSQGTHHTRSARPKQESAHDRAALAPPGHPILTPERGRPRDRNAANSIVTTEIGGRSFAL